MDKGSTHTLVQRQHKRGQQTANMIEGNTHILVSRGRVREMSADMKDKQGAALTFWQAETEPERGQLTANWTNEE
jgi:hypothetical protein